MTIVASWLWLFGTTGFMAIVFASTKMFTKDPSYSPGGSEFAYLVPMLVSVGIGAIGLGLTVLSAVLRLILKAPKVQTFFSASKFAVASFFVVGIGFAYALGAIRGGVSFGGSYSGNEIFAAVNEHRQRIGVAPVKLNEQLCDNLVNRWRVAKGGNFHQGFEEWVKAEGIQTEKGFQEVGEILISAPTPREAVYWWSTSPGHKETMEAKRWTDGCAYAAEGTAVMVFSYK